MELFFAKYHGLGNDFILVEEEEVQTFDVGKLAVTLCDRHTGIGADGLIVLRKQHRLEMLFYNSDGSTAPMCGNGIRCLAHYLYTSGLTLNKYALQTGAGEMIVEIVSEEPFLVKINMGKPDFNTANIPVNANQTEFINQTLIIGNETITLSSVFMGAVHTVVFVDDLEKVNIEKTGEAICHYSLFPNRTNVNFTQVIDRETLRVRTYERGVGPTLACGSGCCAAAVISEKLGHTGKNVKVELALGALQVEVGENVYMTGPAVRVYDGNLSLELIPM
ncbi:MAG: diaminopimelate epimerase [Prevotellaceae bacterium]|jgi:diaminopimelate epimerase|nr:diaminopimelate epimerase [Prevotellaceae bacterium]